MRDEKDPQTFGQKNTKCGQNIAECVASLKEKTEERKVEIMRKLVLVLAILLLAMPAMAVDVTIDKSISGTSVDITYSGTLARAYALEITVDNGQTITGVTPAFVGEGAGYGIFMGTIAIDGTGTVTDDGTPVAPNDAPDAAGTGIGTNKVILEMGSLYDVNGPATSGTLCTVTVSGNCNMTVAVNTTRGEVVLEDATTATTNLPITFAVGECYTGPDYAQWVTVLKPDSWCTPRQCHGDADNAQEVIAKGTYWVGYNDINILLAGFKQAYVNPVSSPWIAADFDHASEVIAKGTYRVGYADINVLLAYFKQGTVPADCNP